jgi:hypothetical protein
MLFGKIEFSKGRMNDEYLQIKSAIFKICYRS